MTDKEPMRIAILGPGAVGGFFAAALDSVKCTVTCIAREESCEVLQRDGLSVDSVVLGNKTIRVHAVPVLQEDVDVLIVATKAPGLPAALKRINAKPRMVLPLLNGFDHMDLIGRTLGQPVVAGAVYIEAIYDGPGKIRQTSDYCRLEVTATAPQLLVNTLRAAGVTVRLYETDEIVLWRKIVPLNALACATAAVGGGMDVVRSQPQMMAALRKCVEEGAQVARAYNVEISIDEIMDTFQRLPSTFSSSMQRDIAAGRQPEIDAIPRALLRRAAERNLECPAISSLLALVEEKVGSCIR